MNELFENIKEGNKQKLMLFLDANTIFFKKNSKDIFKIIKDNSICIVKSGYIQIKRVDYNGNESIIDDLYDNSIFGTLINTNYNQEYEIICKEDTEIVTFDFNNILSYDELKPFYNQFLKNIIKILSNKINENNERIEVLTNKTIRDKILAYFQILSKKVNSNVITIPFNYSNLANYLASNRSAVSRELKNLKDEKLIEVHGKKIKLLYDRF